MWTWLVSLLAPLFEKIFVDLIGQFVSWLSSLWTRHEQEINQEEQAKNHEEVVNNPTSTDQEKKDAANNLLNS